MRDDFKNRMVIFIWMFYCFWCLMHFNYSFISNQYLKQLEKIKGRKWSLTEREIFHVSSSYTCMVVGKALSRVHRHWTGCKIFISQRIFVQTNNNANTGLWLQSHQKQALQSPEPIPTQVLKIATQNWAFILLILHPNSFFSPLIERDEKLNSTTHPR